VIAYVDTSVLLKLIVDEEGSDRASLVWDTADVVVAASVIVVEARAALAAAARGHRVTPAQHRAAKRELSALVDELAIVAVTEELVAAAADLAEEESLRGYNALHLAAALTVEATVMASADADLCAAAERRHLHIANPLDG
jgi:predicted nucleic acid-binding protein